MRRCTATRLQQRPLPSAVPCSIIPAPDGSGSGRPGRRALLPTPTWQGWGWARSGSCSQRMAASPFAWPAPGSRPPLIAQPLECAIIVEDRLPFGPGWISWRALPRLAVEGRWSCWATSTSCLSFPPITTTTGAAGGGVTMPAGMGAFLAQRPGPTFVWSRPTNRAHTTGASVLTIRVGGQERRFPTSLADRTSRSVGGPAVPRARGFGCAADRPPFTEPPRARPDRFGGRARPRSDRLRRHRRGADRLPRADGPRGRVHPRALWRRQMDGEPGRRPEGRRVPGRGGTCRLTQR